jgi:conjugative relaxase-like TrwC/TraI family protein
VATEGRLICLYRREEVIAVMGMQKLTAGSGYDYLTRQVARNDAVGPARTPLADYYDEKGEAPGIWLGSGLAGIEGLKAGDPVTAEQMEFLFGKGLHPLAAQRLALLGPDATEQQRRDAVRLGRPYRQPDTSTSLFRQELHRRYAGWNREYGHKPTAKLPDEVRARLRTELGVEWFTAMEHRAPNARELAGFITRMSRPPATPVAGHDLTFSPVKSVSSLWAIADRETVALIEKAHWAAVTDALRFIEAEVLKTRKGHAGVEQVDVTGLVAVAFTHRDNRAGDPDLHTHVAVANKVQTVADGQWRAIDGRAMHKAITAASETYNTALEAHLGAALGLRFVDVPRTDGRRPVREMAGVDPRLIQLWSTRRREITGRAGELANAFHNEHGRPPTPAERQELYQQATLDTREAKHEPRSRNEQRAVWWQQAVGLLGERELQAMCGRVLHQERLPVPTLDDAWYGRLAATVITRVEDGRAEWQIWHVRAEAQRLARANGVRWDQLDEAIPGLLQTALNSCIPLEPPDDGIREPDALRRADGTSVYRVAGATRYTSQRILFAEHRIVDAAGQRSGRAADHNSVDTALLTDQANGTDLNQGQVQLVRDLATSGRRVQLALAPAGTGKTTAMRALATAWGYSGGNILALAPSATAASQLGEELGQGIHADTLHKLTYEIGQPRPAHWVQAVDADTLIIIDEAGMADTLRLDYLIGWALDRGASIRLIGDDQQLGAISAGGILRDIVAAHGAARLDEVMRFTDPAEAHASLALREGDPAALGYYLDHDRVHVGDPDTASSQLFDAWLADKRTGLDAIMLAPTREQAAVLNQAARDHRLAGHRPRREADLADGNRASIGDTIVTRRNDRRLRAGNGWVKNGDRWQVLDVHRDGGLDVRDQRTNRLLTLPAEYVATYVELGYATTIHGAQGLTADTCHGLLTGQESRQQLYTMLSRGRHANHAYLQTSGDADPHNRLRSENAASPTPTEQLEAILARSDLPTSATTQIAELHDPRTLLAAAVACYQDAIVTAAEQVAGADLISLLDRVAGTHGLADADAWPVARSHLLVLNAQGVSPISALQYAVNTEELDDARDPAAVVDRRLDVVSFRADNDGHRPLPWLPAVPDKVLAEPDWRRYLAARWALVTELAERVQRDAATDRATPRWAAALIEQPAPDTLAQIEVWRAAHAIPEADLRPTGAAQHHLVEARAQRQLDGLIAGESVPVLDWLERIHQAAPGTIDDPATIRLARECAAIDPEGRHLAQRLAQAARQPLPDEHKTDALRYRLEPWLNEVWETWPRQPAHPQPRRHEPPSPSHDRTPGIGI